MQWKEALIERVNARLDSAPLPVDQVLEQARSQPGGIDYTPVSISGRYEAGEAFFEFTTFKGQSGWNMFNLLRLEPAAGSNVSGFALVNRGYIPFEEKDNWQSVAPLPTGIQTITGLLRVPPAQKPGSFMPDNKPETATYYWRDLVTMAATAGLDPDKVAPWYVDEGFPGSQTKHPGSYPVTGTTIISFPNNHLQYAVTWYGLALALLGVGSYFLYARRRPKTGLEDGLTRYE